MKPGEYAVINRDRRYIRYGEDGEELYDLNKDPNEWRNLAADEHFAELKAELEKSGLKSLRLRRKSSMHAKIWLSMVTCFAGKKVKEIMFRFPNTVPTPLSSKQEAII